MQCGGTKPFIVATVIILAAVSEGRGQEWLHLDPLQWSAFTEFDGSWEDREDSGNIRTLEFEEGVHLRQSGDILDPRIADFQLEFEPRFSQEDNSGPGDQEQFDGLNLNYSGFLGLFQGIEFPVGLIASASRSTGDINGDLGSETEFDNHNRSARVNWSNVYFPSFVEYSERFRDETFRSGFTSSFSERDDVVRRLSYRGRSRKMTAFVEREWFDDQIPERDNDSTTNRARLDHRFDWGKGSRLTTQLDYYDRNDFIENDRFTARETATIRHTDDLSSRTSYSFSDSGGEARTRQHLADFGLSHQLYRSLRTNLNLGADFTDTETTKEERYDANLGLNYTKRILWDGTLSLGGNFGYTLNDRDSQDGRQQVNDESHVVPQSLAFTLDRRFIDAATIVITDAAGTFVFTEGFDYEVRSLASDFTEIRVLSGGQIAVGDTVLVSYEFEEVPSAKYYSLPYGFNGALDFGWIRVFHAMFERDEKMISGQDESVLTDRRDSTTGLELSWTEKGYRASASAERRFVKVDEFENTSLDFRQTFSMDLSSSASLNLNVLESFSESDGRDTDLYNADATVAWRPLSSLIVNPRARVWLRDESGDVPRDEWFWAVGLDMGWRWRKIHVDLSYEHNRRGGDISGIEEDRVMLRLSREF
jgi:hypothetical protein